MFREGGRLFRTFSKVLITILAIQFALLLPFETIFLNPIPQKAKAENPTPVAPTPGTVGFVFTSSVRGAILLKYNDLMTAAPFNFTLDNAGAVVSNPTGTIDDNTSYNSVDDVRSQFATTDFRKITDKGASRNFWLYRLSSDQSYYLIIAQKSSGRDYYNFGLWQKTAAGGRQYRMNGMYLPDSANSNPVRENVGQVVNTTALGQKIHWVASVDQSCQQLVDRWPELVGMIKKVVGPNPQENPTYWDKNAPPGILRAIQYGQVAASLQAGPVAALFTTGAIELFNRRVVGWDGSYYLNQAGYNKANQIRGIAKELVTMGEALKGDNDIWPTSPTNCKPAKVTDGLEISTTEFFSKPSEFIAFAQNLLAGFEDQLQNNNGQPDDDACGSGLTNIARIFPWMFCKLADIIHSVATYIINKSIGWLEASIGIPSITFEGSGAQTPGMIDHQNTTTRTQIKEAAVALCNRKKPPVTARATWDTGPCLTNNMDNTGYAVDIAHEQRTAIDNANTCNSPTKWIELDTFCEVIGEQH